MKNLEINKETEFSTASHSSVSLKEVIKKIMTFYYADPNYQYRLSIGTDSMTHDETHFVLAIVLHRVGNGGIYFYKRMTHPRIENLRDKLYKETQLSLDATEILMEEIMEEDEDLFNKLNLSIHLDIGENGPTKALIRELEGWVRALGYDYEIKPDSYAASTIADLYSK